jgi:hypothetical protein
MTREAPLILHNERLERAHITALGEAYKFGVLV